MNSIILTGTIPMLTPKSTPSCARGGGGGVAETDVRTGHDGVQEA